MDDLEVALKLEAEQGGGVSSLLLNNLGMLPSHAKWWHTAGTLGFLPTVSPLS